MKLNYPQKKNGMFILYQSDIDDIATMVLKEYAPYVFEHPQPVDIVSIAEDSLYLTLKSENISPSKEILGITAFSDGEISCYDNMLRPVMKKIHEGTVIINSCLDGSINTPRRRFTNAHESAHWILHRSYHSPQNRQYQFRSQQRTYIACRASNVERDNYRSGTKDDNYWLEWQADHLAAALLMPAITFRSTASQLIKSNTGNNQLLPFTEKRLYSDIVKAIARVFDVSNKATEIRLKYLGLVKNDTTAYH